VDPAYEISVVSGEKMIVTSKILGLTVDKIGLTVEIF
jgi:hypothetical protein